MKKYLLKYTFEFLVIVLGISVSFWLNNWSESVKENNIEKDLVNLLIIDVENKKNESKNDIGIFNSAIETFEKVLNTWETTKKIDTTHLKSTLRYLRLDTPYFNEISPIYNSLSNTKLWKNLPYELVNEINNLYRMRYQEIKIRFEKIREIGTYCKLHFLLPNDLIDLNRDTEVISTIINTVDTEYVLNVKLLSYSVKNLSSLTKKVIDDSESIIENLKNYNKTKL
ncbi:MAG: hypothetical protein ACI6PN_00200 [Polaribacter sp.]|uniref:hypothetical protein n=1 Tax=Polaribacter sp. TaxID=1920175 RepID=UPI00384B60E4